MLQSGLSLLKRLREDWSDRLSAKGVQALVRDESKAAIRWFTAAIWIDRTNVYAMYARAEAFERAGLLMKAIQDYSSGLSLDHDDFSAYLSRAKLHGRLGDATSAKKDLDEAVRHNRQGSEAPHARGKFHMNAKQYDLAIADFTLAISFDKNCAEAHLNRGISHHVHGRLEQAVENYTAAINIDPDHIFSLVSRGKFLEWDRQKLGLAPGEVAPQRLGPNIRLEPCLATAFFNRGVSYFDLGEPQTALADFRQAFALDPSYALPHGENG